MIRFLLIFLFNVSNLGFFAQELPSIEYNFPRSLLAVHASIQRMDLFSGVAYQKNLKKIDLGGSLAVGIRSTFGAQQVFPQLGAYFSIPFLKNCKRTGAMTFGPMVGFHVSFLNIGDKIRQYDMLAGYALYVGKMKGKIQFIHQAGIGPFAEFFRSETNGFVKSYHWNYHFKFGLAYAIY
jgi:hypothetical protein